MKVLLKTVAIAGMALLLGAGTAQAQSKDKVVLLLNWYLYSELDEEVDRDITINQIIQIVLLSFLGIGLLLAVQAAGVYASMAQSQATQSFGSLLLLPVLII